MGLAYRVDEARSIEEVAGVRDLILEYVRGLGIDIAIKGFEDELPGFPGPYAPPRGGLLLARDSGGAKIGCVSLQGLARSGACEMKRLYVRHSARGHGVGRALVVAAIAKSCWTRCRRWKGQLRSIGRSALRRSHPIGIILFPVSSISGRS